MNREQTRVVLLRACPRRLPFWITAPTSSVELQSSFDDIHGLQRTRLGDTPKGPSQSFENRVDVGVAVSAAGILTVAARGAHSGFDWYNVAGVEHASE